MLLPQFYQSGKGRYVFINRWKIINKRFKVTRPRIINIANCIVVKIYGSYLDELRF